MSLEELMQKTAARLIDGKATALVVDFVVEQATK